MTKDYDSDIMINHISHMDKQEITADKIIKELQYSIEEIGPVYSLTELVKDCNGDTIYDKIREYFRLGGKEEDFHNIKDEQKIAYIKHRNIKGNGAKSYEAKLKFKRVAKDYFRKILIAAIMLAILATGSIKLYRDFQFKEAIDTTEKAAVVDQLNNYDEGLNSINIEDLGEINLEDFSNFLEENSFGEYEIIYLTNEILGREYADSICQKYGHNDLNDFLDKYFFDSVISNDGETVFQKFGSYRKLANCVEESIKSKTPNLERLIESYKTGIGRKM